MSPERRQTQHYEDSKYILSKYSEVEKKVKILVKKKLKDYN
jgi:hypothetical protein